MKLTKYSSIFFIFFLSSCFASESAYIEPNNLDASYPTIKSYDHTYLVNKLEKFDFRTNVMFAFINAIDNKSIDYGWLNPLGGDKRDSKRVVMTPGQHIINIETNIGIWQGQTLTDSKNQINLSLHAKYGHYYQLQLRVIGHNIKIWIQDQTGKISSRIVVVPQHVDSVLNYDS